MSKKKILFLTLLITFLFLIAGCFEKKECDTSSDCQTLTCRTVKCSEGECEYNTLPNCCGNLECEPNAGENECTCQKDCGECEGTETFKDASSGRERETEYLSYMCVNNECMLDSDRQQEELFKEKAFSYFDLGITSSFEQPFDVLKSVLAIKFDLEDAHKNLVPPIKFTEIKVMDRQNHILGEIDIESKLDKVGDSFEEELSLFEGTSVLEEEKYVKLRISYEYSILEPTGERDEAGERIYAPSAPKRDNYEYQFSNKLVFVNPRGATE